MQHALSFVSCYIYINLLQNLNNSSSPVSKTNNLRDTTYATDVIIQHTTMRFFYRSHEHRIWHGILPPEASFLRDEADVFVATIKSALCSSVAKKGFVLENVWCNGPIL